MSSKQPSLCSCQRWLPGNRQALTTMNLQEQGPRGRWGITPTLTRVDTQEGGLGPSQSEPKALKLRVLLCQSWTSVASLTPVGNWGAGQVQELGRCSGCLLHCRQNKRREAAEPANEGMEVRGQHWARLKGLRRAPRWEGRPRGKLTRVPSWQLWEESTLVKTVTESF